MIDNYKIFLEAAETKAFDEQHRKTIKFNISRYDAAVCKGKQQYKNLELAKQRVANIKHRVINDLDKYLIEFESAFVARGGKIIWAVNKEEAIKEILSILQKYETKNVVKSKSMTTEELDINEMLEENKIESIETDLGEYIVQLAGEKPYHIVTPAMHKSKEDVAKLFNKKFGLSKESTPEQITAFVRKILRDKFTAADVGVTGANFLIADVGGIALTENEGNGMMTVSLPKIHIVIAGIEKIIPSIKDLDTLWPLLATHGTGQNISVYNSIITGPRQEYENDGPVEMYVVLVDNGRSELLKQENQRRALSCIRCGACLNSCPIYKNIGGHAYGTTYSGPIGSVITPYMKGIEEYKHLSYASSLCGKCTEVCPAKINLHMLLLHNRGDFVKTNHVKKTEKIIMFFFSKVLTNRWLIEAVNPKIKNYFIQMFFKKAWGPWRKIPVINTKSFNKQWKEQRETNFFL